MSLQSRLVAQFHHPKGALGWLAGRIMASRESNLERNRWTVGLLELEPDEQVLELGPGPGVTLAALLECVPEGRVVALDHSAAMLTQCRRRNAAAIESGRLELVQGSFLELPALNGPFDAIIAVNSLQFDAATPDFLDQIGGLLKPGGRIAVTFQPRGANPTDEKALEFGNKVAAMLEQSGFIECRIETLPLEPVCAVCVLAYR